MKRTILSNIKIHRYFHFFIKRWINNLELSSSSSSCSSTKNNVFLSNLLIRKDQSVPITWYSCGPTVYDSAHLGHARTYVCTDIIRRILLNYFHIPLNFAMGITDIDDKIIEKAKKLQSTEVTTIATATTIQEKMHIVSKKYEMEFFRDLDKLGIMKPNAILRVTDYIPEIIDYIRGIESSGCSYIGSDGIYFDIDTFEKQHHYGKLDITLPSVESYDTHIHTQKRNPRDFVLWKFSKPDDPTWSSVWGDGRPGWHIECSAMTNAYFGRTLDIHSGGIDLKFPHHTNEIAQCEAHNRANEWVKNWIHTGHLYIQGQKMSKSLKNFISIEDYFDAKLSDHPSDDFRIFCLQHKYHSSLHYSQDRIKDAANIRSKILNHLQFIYNIIQSYDRMNDTIKVQTPKVTMESMKLTQRLLKCENDVSIELQNDFNTPEVLRLLVQILGESHQYAQWVIHSNYKLQPIEPLIAITYYIRNILTIFGLLSFRPSSPIASFESYLHTENQSLLFNQSVNSLVNFRTSIRKSNLQSAKLISKLSKILKNTIPSEELSTALSYLQSIKENVNESLVQCDRIRDVETKKIGIKIEDVGDNSVWSHQNKSDTNV